MCYVELSLNLLGDKNKSRVFISGLSAEMHVFRYSQQPLQQVNFLCINSSLPLAAFPLW